MKIKKPFFITFFQTTVHNIMVLINFRWVIVGERNALVVSFSIHRRICLIVSFEIMVCSSWKYQIDKWRTPENVFANCRVCNDYFVTTNFGQYNTLYPSVKMPGNDNNIVRFIFIMCPRMDLKSCFVFKFASCGVYPCLFR